MTFLRALPHGGRGCHVRSLWLCVLLLFPAAGGAQARLGRDPGAAAQPLVLSIGGGVSLGSYQAGLSWALLELYRAANRDSVFAAEFGVPPIELASLAGTSAGNINALIWTLEACAEARGGPPESSLFWRIWVPVGLRQLMREGVPRERRDRALFDRGFFRDSLYRRLEERRAQPLLDEACSVAMGTSLTRLDPDTLKVDELSVLTQRMATAVLARAPLAHEAPHVRFEWPEPGVLREPLIGRFTLLPVADSGAEVDFLRVLELVEASSAFPVAFQPVRLELVDPGTGEAMTGTFLDGGVFDNSPTGLALDLLVGSSAYAPRLADADADTVALVYIHPSRLRGDLARVRARAPGRRADAGLGAALRMMKGALPTARQYELQLWARDRRIRAPDTLHVRVTSRAHPLMGEHAGLFAAFLAEVFREHDFIVGAYDALDFVAREYACGVADDEDACVAAHVARLLAEPPLDFGAAARPLLAQLYAREYPGRLHDSTMAGMLSAAPAPADPGAAIRATLLQGVFTALSTQYDREPERCSMRALPDFIICQRGFREVLAALQQAPDVRAALGAWGARCSAERRPGDDCREQRDLARLLENPHRYGAELMDRLLRRLRAVEHQLHVDRREAARRGEPDPGVGDAELTTDLLMAMYRARPARPRYGFVWSPGSAPEDAWAVHALLPYQLTANLGTGGVDAGMRPTWYTSRPVAITFPITLLAARADTDGSGRHTRGYAGAGAGLALTGVLPGAAELFLFPELGASVQHFRALADGEERGWVSEGYLDVSLLVGRLRVALRHTSEPALFGGATWAMAVGIADFNGLAYWASRLLTHR